MKVHHKCYVMLWTSVMFIQLDALYIHVPPLGACFHTLFSFYIHPTIFFFLLEEHGVCASCWYFGRSGLPAWGRSMPECRPVRIPSLYTVTSSLSVRVSDIALSITTARQTSPSVNLSVTIGANDGWPRLKHVWRNFKNTRRLVFYTVLIEAFRRGWKRRWEILSRFSSTVLSVLRI